MKRLDQELVERNLFKTRSKAAQAIKAGNIVCDGKKITKCGYEVTNDTKIEIVGEVLQYVSRGGLKLEKAIRTWKIELKDKIMLDIGSSTGGFSDCAIQNGIKKVFAIDVGRDQFDTELAKNPKICLMEQTDFRDITEEKIKDANLITIDVSFISVTKLLNKISQLTNVKEIICLIKPQFECGKEIADQYRGIILNSKVHQELIEKIVNAFCEIYFDCQGITCSPIQGGDGNIEYLAYFQKKKVESLINEKSKVEEKKNAKKEWIVETVKEAFENLRK